MGQQELRIEKPEFLEVRPDARGGQLLFCAGSKAVAARQDAGRAIEDLLIGPASLEGKDGFQHGFAAEAVGAGLPQNAQLVIGCVDGRFHHHIFHGLVIDAAQPRLNPRNRLYGRAATHAIERLLVSVLIPGHGRSGHTHQCPEQRPCHAQGKRP